MATQTPFTIQGFFRYPPDDGSPEADRDFSVQGSYKSKVEMDLDLLGSGTHTVSFGTLTALGAKGMLVEVAPADPGATAAPINIRVNGGTENIEVSQGGFWAYGSPNPVAGLLGIQILHTQNACVKIRVLG